MTNGFLNLPYFTWAVIALVIAVIFVYVWPYKIVKARTGFRYFIIRWGHALTWLLLAVSFSRSVRGTRSRPERRVKFLRAGGRGDVSVVYGDDVYNTVKDSGKELLLWC